MKISDLIVKLMDAHRTLGDINVMHAKDTSGWLLTMSAIDKIGHKDGVLFIGEFEVEATPVKTELMSNLISLDDFRARKRLRIVK